MELEGSAFRNVSAVERESSAVTGAYSLLQGPETGGKQGKLRPEQS